MESNKLIAEFMGVKPTMYSPDTYGYVDSPFFSVMEDNPEKVMEAIAKYSKYHTSWDWLIPVIKKIREIVESTNMPMYVGMSQRLNPFEYSIESIYKGVVEYIKNYNYINNL
jgi:hypothetical protein